MTNTKMTVEEIKRIKAEWEFSRDDISTLNPNPPCPECQQIVSLCDTALSLYQELETQKQLSESPNTIAIKAKSEVERLKRFEKAWNKIKKWAIYDVRILHKIELTCGISQDDIPDIDFWVNKLKSTDIIKPISDDAPTQDEKKEEK